jgi:hypothetical protein
VSEGNEILDVCRIQLTTVVPTLNSIQTMRSRISLKSTTPRITLILALNFFVIVLVVSTAVNAAKPITDAATGIRFPSKLRNGLEAVGVGVRKKGPIKVYSVALYSVSSLRETLEQYSRTATPSSVALQALHQEGSSHPSSFRLEMAFKVGADKMATAIADAVAPRHTGPASEVDQLKALILKGVNAKGGTASKGTTFQFDCSPRHGVNVAVDDKPQGGVASPALAKAFCGLYLDDKCVSPSLRENCLDNCCSP